MSEPTLNDYREALRLCVASLDNLLPNVARIPADIGLLNDALMAARPLLKAEPNADRADWARVMDAYGPNTTRCAGGRIQARGFQCPHCGSVDPSTDCREPKEK